MTPRTARRRRAPSKQPAGLQVERRAIADLQPDPNNVRVHGETNLAAIRKSLERFGQQKPIVVDARGRVIAGNGTLAAARALGWDSVDVVVTGLSGADAVAFAIADNRTAELAEWDDAELGKALAALVTEDSALLDATGFDDEALAKIAKETEATAEDGGDDPLDATPEVAGEPVTKRGDVWRLGRHRIACGDSTSEAAVASLLEGCSPTLILTDPPYCSGGFQETGRSQGSIGTKRNDANGRKVVPRIANDMLSTRGFQAMLSRAIELAPSALFALVFTDWRQWLALFEVAERSGFGVRSMIVWDKGTPGMGQVWRSQHELVMWSARGKVRADLTKSIGNVVRLSRQRNEHHPTQKPVELLRTLLQPVHFADVVYDPFAGSGSTLVACEAEGRMCVAMELEPRFVDAAILRWESMTGLKAERAS